MYDLTDNDITEFHALFLAETGRAITREEAAQYALQLLQLVDWVQKPRRPERT